MNNRFNSNNSFEGNRHEGSFALETERLTFRNWTLDDVPAMAEISSNEEVMRHFPSILTYEQTDAFVRSMIAHQESFGYCYFAVELIDTKTFIGFIGLKNQDYGEGFAPFVDIGWRLSPDFWGKGYATEGAMAVCDFAFNQLGFKELYAVATKSNVTSIRIMEKIGMGFVKEFDHPKLPDFDQMKRCVMYIKK